MFIVKTKLIVLFYFFSSPSCFSSVKRYSSTVLKKLSGGTGISSPWYARETLPVSSETTTVTESVISEIPMAALCLEPNFQVKGFVVGV